MRKRLLRELVLVVAVFAGGLVYAVWCEKTQLYVPCIFNKVTNLECPSCGVTHMILAVLNGDFNLVFYYNPVLFCMTPMLLYVLIKMEYTYIRYQSRKLPKMDHVIVCICIGILIIYGVLRNLNFTSV